MTKDQLLAEAMKLEAAEREQLAEALWDTLSPDDQAAVDAAWLAEARRRDEAFKRGEVSASPVEDVIERIRARARS